MRIVCDTSVLIDVLRGDERALSLLTGLADRDELWGVVVTRSDVLSGMRSHERRPTYALLDSIRWREIDRELADRAGELARRYRRSHPGVELPDYLIAAGVELLGGMLLTLNVKHFPMFPDLEPAYY
ncbi:MAG TPA: type II toxin-antitoxin system VapC family toxin [Candidatus Limnocylindria bacterium]|nr:type II toxin-antitoxin system VapC family toxin [Candidatus Limnocylindria bacterium]